MTYLTFYLYKKLNNIVKIWSEYEKNFPIYQGTNSEVFRQVIMDEKCTLSKDEINYLESNGYIKIINMEDKSSNWYALIEPTYSGLHYKRIAICNILLELKWLLPLGLSIASFILTLIC